MQSDTHRFRHVDEFFVDSAPVIHFCLLFSVHKNRDKLKKNFAILSECEWM